MIFHIKIPITAIYIDNFLPKLSPKGLNTIFPNKNPNPISKVISLTDY